MSPYRRSSEAEVYTVEHMEEMFLKLSAADPEGETDSTEDRSLELDHVIDNTPIQRVQMRKRVLERAERKYCRLEEILSAKQESPRTWTLDDFPFADHKQPETILFVGFHGQHRKEECKKTIKLSKTETEVRKLEKLSLLENMPALLPAPFTAASSTGSIYCKLYHRFLAHRILYRKRTNKNRNTSLTSRERKDVSAWNTENENGGWGWETVSEKEKRQLNELGVQVSHTQLTWDQQQFIETHTFGKFGCYRPSYLRWSWTMRDEMGEEEDDEASPNEGNLTTGPTVEKPTQGLQASDLTSMSVQIEEA